MDRQNDTPESKPDHSELIFTDYPVLWIWFYLIKFNFDDSEPCSCIREHVGIYRFDAFENEHAATLELCGIRRPDKSLDIH